LIGLAYPGPPVVVRQPQDQTVRARERASLSVVASSGVKASYQWHQQPSDRPDGLISGATNTTHLSPPLFTNTVFWVSISNSAGATLSERATVTVVGSGFPWLAVVAWGVGTPFLTLEGIRGKFYEIEYRTNLSAGTWVPLLELKLSSDSYTSADDTARDSPMRFYRAVVLPSDSAALQTTAVNQASTALWRLSAPRLPRTGASGARVPRARVLARPEGGRGYFDRNGVADGRAGDYSFASLDPDGATCWTVQQFGENLNHLPDGSYSWGSWITSGKVAP
jgi:hypothetical protein